MHGHPVFPTTMADMSAHLLLSLFAILLLAGCRTPEKQVWAGASPEVRTGLGVVRMQLDREESRDFTFAAPSTRGEATRDMAGLAIAKNLDAAEHAGNAWAVVLMGVPAAAAGGAIYGAVSGVRPHHLHRGLINVTNVSTANRLFDRLPQLLKQKAQQTGFIELLNEDDPTPVDQVLHLRVVSQQLAYLGIRPNPSLVLRVIVNARLTDSRGLDIYSTYVERQSQPRSFIEWSEKGGQRLRNDFRKMQDELAATIVQRVFLGESSE